MSYLPSLFLKDCLMKKLLALAIWPMFALMLLLVTTPGCENGGGLRSSTMTIGEKLYRAKCASCHRLRNPKTETDEDWAYYVEEYGEKVSEADKALILGYLQANN